MSADPQDAGDLGELEDADEPDEGWRNPEWSAVWDGPVVVSGVRSHLAYLPWSLGAALGVAVPTAVVGAVVDGRVGASAGLAGILTVVAFFAVSTVAVAWADRRDPRLTLPVAAGTYVVKVVAAGVVAFRVVHGTARWHGVFAAALGVGLLAWLGAQVVWFWRTPPPAVRPAGEPGGPGPTGMNVKDG